MRKSNFEIPYQILNYNTYHARIESLLEQNNSNKYIIKKHGPFGYTDCGFPVEHYSIGDEKKHIIVIGGTHGCEIISVDFVTQLMKQVAEGNIDEFSPDEFTIDFMPLHNPEGFIVASSAAYYKLDGLNDKEIEKFCHDYWALYRQDDINSRKNSDNHDLNLHHKLFKGITIDCIPEYDEMHSKLKNKIKVMLENKMGNYKIPVESLIDFRANGNGVELNGNNPNSYKKKLSELQDKGNTIFGARRFGDIPNAINGPLGMPSNDMSKFKYENENKCLFNYLSELNKRGEYYLTTTYHGTGGLIYYRPYDLSNNETEKASKWKDLHNISETFNYNDVINEVIASNYCKETGYSFMKTPSSITGVGDVLRSVYPGFLLIELSKMGGNPIAPYGDRYGNYEPTIKSNLRGFGKALDTIRKIEYLYRETFSISRYEFNARRSK